MKDRKQLNLRLDNEGELLEEIKEAARLQNISLNQFVINALKLSLGQPIESARQGLDVVLDRVENLEKSVQSLHVQVAQLGEEKAQPIQSTSPGADLTRLHGTIDELTKRYELHAQRFIEVETLLNIVTARQALAIKLDKQAEGDLEPKTEPEQQVLDNTLDTPVETVVTGKRLFTDVEVAHELSCDKDYIRNVRLGIQHPKAEHSHIWEYWEPAKKKAMWRKIKNLPVLEQK